MTTFMIVLCGLLFAASVVIAVLLLFRGVDKTLEQMDAIAPPVLPRPEPRIRPKSKPSVSAETPIVSSSAAASPPKAKPVESPEKPPTSTIEKPKPSAPEPKPELPITLPPLVSTTPTVSRFPTSAPKPFAPVVNVDTKAPEPKIIERVVEVIKEVFVPAPTPPAIPPEAIKVRFTSAKGRLLAEDVLLPKQRRPCVKRNVDGVQSVFQCSHKDGETWVYRRQSVERE
jgi:hypothetical protein